MHVVVVLLFVDYVICSFSISAPEREALKQSGTSRAWGVCERNWRESRLDEWILGTVARNQSRCALARDCVNNPSSSVEDILFGLQIKSDLCFIAVMDSARSIVRHFLRAKDGLLQICASVHAAELLGPAFAGDEMNETLQNILALRDDQQVWLA
jgi:hypothetical protein